MDLGRARYLVSPAGRSGLQSLLHALSDLPPHRLADELRRAYPPFEASALAEQVTLRRKARNRFGDDLGLLYTAPGLEMMTHPLVASRRAGRLAAHGIPVFDLTCGIGGDLRAIVLAGARAVGMDRDPVAALVARMNARADIVQGDALRPPFALGAAAVVLDPSRRSGVPRRFDPAAFSPPWGAALDLAREGRAAVIKGPPGIDLRHVPADAEIEFVQLGRSLRESSIWMGDGASPGLRQGVLLDTGATLDSSAPEVSSDTAPLESFVFDPESCVTRAGLVRQLAHSMDARMMDSHVAYLTAGEAAFHPMAATFEVLDSLPFSLARLRGRLREKGWRPDEIRRRAFPIEPDELRALVGHLEGERVTLLCTTIDDQRMVLIARRLLEADT